MRSLLERRLVRIAGHREVPGRPLLYATSRRFLEVFGLARLEDLPTLRDLEEFAPEGALPTRVGSNGVPDAGKEGGVDASVGDAAITHAAAE